jgi:hypothetical protein
MDLLVDVTAKHFEAPTRLLGHALATYNTITTHELSTNIQFQHLAFLTVHDGPLWRETLYHSARSC